MGNETNKLKRIENVRNLSNTTNLINIIDDDVYPKYIVGIDFGSAGIGYAYSLCDNKNNIVLSDFKEQCDNKIPNQIILDNNLNNVLAFGFDCSRHIRSHEKDTYQYFKDIKMNLYKKIYKIKSTNGAEADIEMIITKILKIISDEAINQIKRKDHKKYEKNEMKWVVTIPAIWEEKSKEIMINASRNAGLINEKTDLSLFLALEPEVAGIFYFSELYSNIEDENYGIPYIICDIGAGTVDICTYIKEKPDKDDLIINANANLFNSVLIEEYPPIGGDYGGNYINEEFIKRLIIELFGAERVEKLKNDVINEGWKKFEDNIETLKRDFSEQDIYDCKLDCRLFKEKGTKKKLNDYIAEYNKKKHEFTYQLKINPNEKWELMFSSQIFIDITKEISKKIFLLLEKVYNNVNKAEIIFTGAGSNNTNLINHIEDFIKEKKLELYVKTSYQPQIAVLKGSVLFGFQNSIIRKRKSRYTIGIKSARDWDDNLYKDKGIKEFNEMENNYKCTNLFLKYISKNEYIGFDQVISRTLRAIDKKITIKFYKTSKNDCTYIDEKDENNKLILEKFGEAELNMEDNFDMDNREVKIDMKMGGTYIVVSAIYLKNEQHIETIQHFC